MNHHIFLDLQTTFESLNFDDINQDRKTNLLNLSKFVQRKLVSGQIVNLNFICTHNSRRSHLAQIWAQAAAYYCNLDNVFCYSGGTEATALFPATANALVESGFEIDHLSKGNNPIYMIKFADLLLPVIGFSKTYDHRFNPQSGFAAVMTCSHADDNCPVVTGADMRFSLPFEDPKAFDGTAIQSEQYLERSLQIATEMLFIFKNVKV